MFCGVFSPWTMKIMVVDFFGGVELWVYVSL